MSKSIFDMMGGKQPQRPDMMSQFGDFMRMMQGQNPNEVINGLVQSGKLNQQQLNQAQTMANNMKGMFAPFFSKT